MEVIDITLPLTCAFIVSYISTIGCHSNIYEYVKDLSPELQKKYNNLKCERAGILTLGFIFSLILAILYYRKSINTENYTRLVNSALIFVSVPMIFYKLFPKTSYMLQEPTENPDDTKDWFKIYLCMKNATMYSFVITFIVVFIIFKKLKPRIMNVTRIEGTTV